MAGFSSEKEKIPKDWRYPLRASVLSDRLAAAGVEIHTHLTQSAGTQSLFAEFWPPNPNVPYERLYISGPPVLKEHLFATRAHIENVILPDLMAWISEILRQPEGSPVRREKQWCRWDHYPGALKWPEIGIHVVGDRVVTRVTNVPDPRRSL
jgi:hypothetical protein